MIAWISNWVGGIAVSVILATIIEMLIPNGINKKYVKTIIGLFILFSIIGPVISKFSNISIGQELSVGMVENGNIVEEVGSNKELEKVYRTNLDKDIKDKLYEKGYDVLITALSISFVEGENYGKINRINLKVNNLDGNNEKTNNSVNEIEKIEVNVNGSKEIMDKDENRISDETKEEIKEYISNEYKIDKEYVEVN